MDRGTPTSLNPGCGKLGELRGFKEIIGIMFFDEDKHNYHQHQNQHRQEIFI